MRNKILINKALIATSLFFMLQAGLCRSKSEDAKQALRIKDACRELKGVFSALKEIRDVPLISNNRPASGNITSITSSNDGASDLLNQEVQQFLDCLNQMALQINQVREQLEGCTPLVSELLNEVEEGFKEEMQAARRAMTSEHPYILEMSPHVVIRAEKIRKKAIDTEQDVNKKEKKSKVVDTISKLQQYCSAKGMLNMDAFLSQMPTHFVEGLRQALNKVKTIKQLLLDKENKGKKVIKELAECLKALLMLHDECCVIKQCMTFELSDESTFLSVWQSFSQLELCHQKIEHSNNSLDNLRDLFSKLADGYRSSLEECPKLLGLISQISQVDIEKLGPGELIEPYFILLEVFYIYWYGLMLVEEIAIKIKDHTSISKRSNALR